MFLSSLLTPEEPKVNIWNIYKSVCEIDEETAKRVILEITIFGFTDDKTNLLMILSSLLTPEEPKINILENCLLQIQIIGKLKLR